MLYTSFSLPPKQYSALDRAGWTSEQSARGLPQYRRRRPVRSTSEKALGLPLLLSLRALVRVGVTSADEMTDG